MRDSSDFTDSLAGTAKTVPAFFVQESVISFIQRAVSGAGAIICGLKILSAETAP